MNTAFVRSALILGVVLGGVQPLAAQTLPEGVWTGHLVSPTSEFFDVSYVVTAEMGAPNIRMEWSRGPTPFYAFRQDQDSLWFAWDMEEDFRLNCILMRVEKGHHEGACKGPYGGIGLLTMVPPGKTLSEDDIDPDALLGVWDIVSVPPGWAPEDRVPEPEPEPIDLDALYDADAIKGSLVDVGGYRLNLFQTGEGEPTVVLESGKGDDLREWSKVLTMQDLGARVVAYDRAGMGFSDPSPGSRSPEQMATELRRLLRKAGLQPPFVLVGHAEGGLVVRRFASLYSGDVGGLVLVDATHEELGVRWQARAPQAWKDYQRQQKTFQVVLPGPVRAEYEAFSRVLAEGEVPGLGALPEVPVVVLTAMRPYEAPRWFGETPEGQQIKHDLHASWVEQTKNGTHRVTETSGTYIHREEPELVIWAIQQVLEAVREQ